MTTQKAPHSTRKMPPPIVLIGLGLLLIGAGYQGFRLLSRRDSAPSSQSTPIATNQPSRLSAGEQILIPANQAANQAAKQTGVQAFANGDYPIAIAHFQESLRQQPNDPETRIYFNNAKAIAGNPLKLAVSVPIGSNVNLAQEVLRGVAQSQQETNDQGGVNGRKLLIVIANDNDELTASKNIAQQFVDRPEIMGVIGHTASSITLGVAPIYDRGRLVTISPISSAVQLSSRSPYVFRTLPSDYVAARSLADHMLTKLQHKKAVVFFNSQSDYSKSLKGEFSTAIALGGGQVVAEFDLADSGLSPSKSLERAIQQGAQTIMLASNTSVLDRSLQIVQANRNRLAILAGDDVYSPKTLEVSREQGMDMVVAVPWHILSDPTARFPTRSRQLWGSDINWRTVTAYDATQALTAALTIKPTRTGIQQALTTDGFQANGAAQAVKFLPSGDRNMGVQLVTIVKGNRSGYGFDFEPLLR
jgi:branched-chain amino acid transport system substrate-binding protein